MKRFARPIAAALLAAAAACEWGDARRSDTIASEEILTDVGPLLAPARPQVLLDTGRRAPARLVHPTADGEPLSARLTVPDGGALAFEFAVGNGPPARSGQPVRLSVVVDGEERFTRTLDPARRNGDRRWRATRVDLNDLAGRSVVVTLRADVVGDGEPAGLAGWNRVHLVRVHRTARRAATPRAPNVVVLLVDTLRADALGCYGAEPSPTPALDALARDGTLFEDVVAPAPWTLPSVATVLTGHYPREHGVVMADNPGPGEHGAARLPPRIPTLAALAQRAGVTTFALTANPLVSPDSGLSAGFEHFDDPPANRPPRGWLPGEELNARFGRWARRNRDVRFLAYLHYMEAHSPYATPSAPAPPPGVRADVATGEASRFSRRLLRGEPVPSADEIAYLRRLYTHAVAGWDRVLADLLHRLDDLGLRDRTVIVVTADHGEEFMEHGHLAHGKQLFEESIRVPLVLAGPGVPRERRTDPAQLVDVLPTLTGLLDAPRPAGLPGVDLLAAAAPARPAFAEARRGIAFGRRDVSIAMVREPPWKIVWTPDLDRAALFHLDDDPAERDDRAAEKAVTDRLLAAVRRYWERDAPEAGGSESPGLAEKLRLLGYAE